MKKLICALLVVILSLGCLAATCETVTNEDFVAFDASLVNAMEMSADDWMELSYGRAMLTILLSLSLTTESEDEVDFSDMFENDTYVGKADAELMIGGIIDNDPIIIVYNPSTGSASYLLYNLGYGYDIAVTTIKAMFDSLCADNYYINDSDDLQACVESLQEVIESIE